MSHVVSTSMLLHAYLVKCSFVEMHIDNRFIRDLYTEKEIELDILVHSTMFIEKRL